MLDLSKNYILSIESLSWLNSPKISLINLENNKITSIKSYNKCHFRLLKNLNVGDNLLNHKSLKDL